MTAIFVCVMALVLLLRTATLPAVHVVEKAQIAASDKDGVKLASGACCTTLPTCIAVVHLQLITVRYKARGFLSG